MLDSKGEFASSNTVFIYEAIKPFTIYTLAGIVNSTLMSYIYKSTFSGLNMLGSFQFQAPQLRIMPIPKNIDVKILMELEKNVKNLVQESDLTNENGLQLKIDENVFDLYKITKEEVSLIRSSLHELETQSSNSKVKLEEDEDLIAETP